MAIIIHKQRLDKIVFCHIILFMMHQFYMSGKWIFCLGKLVGSSYIFILMIETSSHCHDISIWVCC